ncbi:MAG: phenylalanine--tRNA ligase subunit alpha [Rhodothermales bacterium]|nr:phenylalanine--tRNA ligase subunit alpha [Rhodothermales bacterium]
MVDQLEKIKGELEQANILTGEELEEFRIRYLSKKQGRITELLKLIPTIEPADRKAFGQQVNVLKTIAEGMVGEARTRLESTQRSSDVPSDLTLPGSAFDTGTLHVITETRNEIVNIFERYGFTVADGPELEDDWHNFTALNFPPEHPARDMQDTVFIEPPGDQHDGILMRTHTSPVQVRVLKEQKPPVRVIVPGRVYRNESISYKSYCLFHQVEGLYLDEGVSMADLKHLLHMFSRTIFGDDVVMRFRPSFFPFTEPSAEVDIWWKDDSHPEGGRWLEILGSGMVDPNVLDALDIDSEKYTGYAFGMGIERIAMLKHGIPDIRLLYENDLRFLSQF